VTLKSYELRQHEELETM